VEENWRSKRAWRSYEAQLKAQGEKLSLPLLAPEPVADDQNFAQTPFLAPLFDFREDRATNPGPSPWRDTNAHNRVATFASDLIFPGSFDNSWRKGELIDLSAWAAALTKGTNYSVADVAAFTRTRAASVILQHLEKYQPVLDELREASKRPHSRFNIKYQDNIATLIPHVNVLKSISRIYALRASAELALDKNEKAFADVRMALYLGDAIGNEPILVSKLVRVAILQQALQPVWEGLKEHKWSGAQLAGLQQLFSNYDFLAETTDAFRGERALVNDFMDQFRTVKRAEYMQAFSNAGPPNDAQTLMFYFVPSAVFYQNQLKINRIYQELFLPMVTPAQHRVHPEIDTDGKVEEQIEKGFPGYRVFARMLVPSISKAAMKMANAQVVADQAMLACALERYRLANNQLPASLDELKPRFIDRIPHDVINGEPLKYRRINDQQFALYSVGWNQKDDNGAIVIAKNVLNTIDIKSGDWVWPHMVE
jgi:hypothetical protein